MYSQHLIQRPFPHDSHSLNSSLTPPQPTLGVDPSYKDCRPHIDATLRDLASKALSAREQQSVDLNNDEGGFIGPQKDLSEFDGRMPTSMLIFFYIDSDL